MSLGLYRECSGARSRWVCTGRSFREWRFHPERTSVAQFRQQHGLAWALESRPSGRVIPDSRLPWTVSALGQLTTMRQYHAAGAPYFSFRSFGHSLLRLLPKTSACRLTGKSRPCSGYADRFPLRGACEAFGSSRPPRRRVCSPIPLVLQASCGRKAIRVSVLTDRI